MLFFFFFQAEDGIRGADVTGVQTCALPISSALPNSAVHPWWVPRSLRSRPARVAVIRADDATPPAGRREPRRTPTDPLKCLVSRASRTAGECQVHRP